MSNHLMMIDIIDILPLFSNDPYSTSIFAVEITDWLNCDKHVIDYEKWKENENFQDPFNLGELRSNEYEE